MDNFENLKNLWSQQPPSNRHTSAAQLIEKAEANMKKLRIGQYFTVGILSTLSATLVAYYLWVAVDGVNMFTVGLGTMVGVILIRVILELISMKKLSRIQPDSALTDFSIKMATFYGWRRRIQSIFVPIIYVSYTAGFVLLLPAFKDNLSPGMYWYVVISGSVILIGMAIFVRIQVQKEIRILNLLKVFSLEEER
jgi:hypothetical protein